MAYTTYLIYTRKMLKLKDSGKLLIPWFISFIFISSCTTNNHPPNRGFAKNNISKMGPSVLKHLRDNQRQALLYMNSKNMVDSGKLDKACQSYRQLANDEKFPLVNLAKIKRFKTCTEDRPPEKWWNFYQQNFRKSFLAREYLEASLEVAERLDDNRHIALFARELAAHKTIRSEREKLIKYAIKAAKKTKDKKLVNQIKETLYSHSPRLNPKPLSNNLYAKARDFERNRQFKKARKIYKKIIKRKSRPLTERTKAYFRFAMTYKLERERRRYMHHLGKMCKWLKKKIAPQLRKGKNPAIVTKWYEKRILYAKTLWTENNMAAGKKELLSILKERPDNQNILTDTFRILALMHFESKENDQAFSYLAKAKKTSVNNGENRDIIYWLTGWHYYLDKQYEKSIATLNEAWGQTTNIAFKRKLRFWTAKSPCHAGG